MSYDIHITKANNWVESNKNPISLNEWHSYIEKDKSLTLEPESVAINPVTKEEIRMKNPGLAIWKNPKNGKEYGFDYRNGKISFRYTDEEAIKKAKEIASHFGAVVQGDEEEKY